MTRNKYGMLAVLLVAALALVLQGCGGDDNGVRVETVEVEVPADPEIVEVEVEVPDDSGLEGVQGKAADAAAAAKMAADNAQKAADDAMTATATIATLQTGGMAEMEAMNAKKYADMAMTAYEAAKEAAAAAAAATTTEAATEAKVKAEAAQANAEKYAMMVANEDMTGYADKAKMSAAMELMIDGKDKSVGESMVNAGAGMLTDPDSNMKTGRLKDMDPMNKVAMQHGQAGMQDNPNTAMDEAKTPMAAVAAMNLAIGRTLDTSDDMARLMLVTHYAGSKMVKVFDYAADVAEGFVGTKAKITNDGTNTYAANEGALTYKGMYYLATGATANDLVAADPTGTAPNLVNASDTVAGTGDGMMGVPKPVEVYSYTNKGSDAADASDDVTHYVIVNSFTTTGGETEYNYRQVDVMVTLPTVGDASATPPQIQHPLKDVSVMAKLPDAKAYDHLHFGVWASLGDADKETGDQDVDDLGIGFVQSIGDGMTAIMPNQGKATYMGDWAATVQGASEGAISLEHGPATLTADIDKSMLTAKLTGLATLTADLTGNTFKGTKAVIDDDDPFGLNSSGKFTGEFSGGFYGDKAVEAGGVFDFTSKDIADGAFRGAVGGHRDDLN